ncbi:helix-turn-helix transcriptional regulator [Streptomyces sp. NBC_00258]|uniref:helix-turn-helix transcriptional regulator n=1 Tax=Streptomyces sp. NBC_00258 TaxID=2903642 RepID=UPI002E2D00A5|nr:LuxR C-terminal-related transcriptional regulator [Streptomyces sp. NBC_00258]
MVSGTSRAAGNLSAEVTNLVGRRGESAEVRRLLAASRLVTLTGPGGVGKTRLAIDVARRLQSSFHDGAWLTALAQLTEPDLLVPTLMSAIDNGAYESVRVEELTALIGDRQMLLVLDNCEHLLDACAALTAEVLRSCPYIRVLTTSLEPLQIDGESLYRVPPLSVTLSGRTFGAAVAGSDAVKLFMQRARAFNPDFSTTEDEERAIVDLCRRLDGLPLAIELAAAATRAMPVKVLAERARDALTLRSAGSRTAPSRHQTLRATMDYTYQLCSGKAGKLWACMSVFRSGVDIVGLEQVCVGDDLPLEDLWSTLAELVDKSIVNLNGSRYVMLEVIRRYGQERLTELGEEDVVRSKLRSYVEDIVDELHSGWFGPGQQAVLARVLTERASVRDVLSDYLRKSADLRSGLRVAANLWPLWISSGNPAEGRHWLDALLTASTEPTQERAAALWVDARLTLMEGDLTGALRLLDECESVASALGDLVSLARATTCRGGAYLYAGRVEDAMPFLKRGVKLERNLQDDNPHRAVGMGELAFALILRGDLEGAEQVLNEAKAFCARHGEQLLLSWVLVYQGLVALLDERVGDCVALVVDALDRKRAVDDPLGITYAIEILGWASFARGDARRAAALLSANEVRAERPGTHLMRDMPMVEWHASYVGQVRERLGARAFEAAWERGRRLTGADLFDYALAAKVPAVHDAPDLPLTPREREIAELVAVGKTNKEIASTLVIAHRTVDTHVENILTKLDFKSRTQIAALFGARARPET